MESVLPITYQAALDVRNIQLTYSPSEKGQLAQALKNNEKLFDSIFAGKDPDWRNKPLRDIFSLAYQE